MSEDAEEKTNRLRWKDELSKNPDWQVPVTRPGVTPEQYPQREVAVPTTKQKPKQEKHHG